MKSLLAIGLSSLLTNVIFGTLTFKETMVAPIDKCIDLDNTSIIYRCSEDSIWKYYYEDSNACNGVASISHYGGCANSAMNLVERCKIAQNLSASTNGDCKYYVDKNNKNAYPIDVCYNYNAFQSRKYTCESGQVYLSTYSDEDCRGSAASVIAQNSSYFDCDGVDCHASANLYNLSSTDTCNYPESEGSQYVSGSDRECNYILLADQSAIPYATGVCFSNREGYYEYSYKYLCNGSDVNLYQWIDNSECDSDSKHYLISTYTGDNYTIQCGYDNCKDGKIRTYDDCDHKAYYTERPIAWDQCIKYFHDPNTGNNDTYDEYQYYKYTCIDGYLSVFYFLDSDCSDMNTFYVYNTSTSSCPTVVSGCSNKNDAFLSSSSNMFKYYYSYIIAMMVVLIKQLF